MACRRETSNALNALVRCEQKRLQRLSETVVRDYLKLYYIGLCTILYFLS